MYSELPRLIHCSGSYLVLSYSAVEESFPGAFVRVALHEVVPRKSDVCVFGGLLRSKSNPGSCGWRTAVGRLANAFVFAWQTLRYRGHIKTFAGGIL